MKINLLQMSVKHEDNMTEFFKQNYIQSLCLRGKSNSRHNLLDMLGLENKERSLFIFNAKKNQDQIIKEKIQSLEDKHSFLVKFQGERSFNMEQSSNRLIVTVITAGFADIIIDTAKQCGETGSTTISGKGVGANYSSFLGVSLDSEKDVVLIVSNTERYKNTINQIKKAILKLENAKEKGICFALPVTDFEKFC